MNRLAMAVGYIVLAVVAREIVFIGSVAVKNRLRRGPSARRSSPTVQ